MVGIGYDIHRLAKGESLVLGGVRFDTDFGTVAHSDGDVLLHSIMDAILGAAAMGDIGEHFPDTDPKFKNANSIELLQDVCHSIEQKNLKIINIDATLILEKPKIKNYKKQMEINIANACGIDTSKVNVKATTNEMIGAVGRSEGVAAMSVCQLANISE